MLLSVVTSYLPYGLTTSLTPGPNNIVALHAASQNGFKKSAGILAGMAVGFPCIMLLCGFFCYELAQFMPSIINVLKYVGAAYILYLAIHVALSKPAQENTRRKGFISGFLLQFANAKVILYAITVFTCYVLPHQSDWASVLVHAGILTLIGLLGPLLWALIGELFQKWLQKYYRPFNIVMGLVLLWCAVSLVIG